MAAVVVGLLGSAGGLVWLVAGVWTVRSVWGSPPNLTWGLACLGAGARWGTTSIGDIEAATRIFGPTVATGGQWARLGLACVAAAALISEARCDGLRARSWAERAAAVAALAALVPAYVAPGPGDPNLLVSLAWWAASGAAAVALALGLAQVAARLPGWLPPAAAALGLGLTAVVS